MITNANLDLRERRWLQMFLEIPCLCKEALQKQIESATVKREYTDYYIFLTFSVPESVGPITSIDERVPMEVIVSHSEGTGDNPYEIQYGGNSIPVTVDENKLYPTSFILHFSKGYVHELEVYNLDSSALDVDSIYIGKRNYRISPAIAQT